MEILKVNAVRKENTKGGKHKWLVDEPTVSASFYMHAKAEKPKIVEVTLLEKGEEA